jgi:hypothetical protein
LIQEEQELSLRQESNGLTAVYGVPDVGPAVRYARIVLPTETPFAVTPSYVLVFPPPGPERPPGFPARTLSEGIATIFADSEAEALLSLSGTRDLLTEKRAASYATTDELTDRNLKRSRDWPSVRIRLPYSASA